MTATNGTFVLGLGAQKAGTSWLHDYLGSDEAADFGRLKEYHVWDALDLPGMAHFDVRPGRTLNRTFMRAKARLTGASSDTWDLRGRMQAQPETYFEHFDQLLRKPGIRLTGDITPAYAGLPVGTLRRIRDGFLDRGIAVKAVFVMRDPATRAISAARMNRRKRDWREGVPLRGSLDAAVLAYVRSTEHELRADYAGTIERIRSVFEPEETRFEFYEALFTPDRLASLSRFLGVAYRPERAATRVYSGGDAAEVAPETVAALREELAATYDYCAVHFPETKTLWRA